jgi:hypothetical protein
MPVEPTSYAAIGGGLSNTVGDGVGWATIGGGTEPRRIQFHRGTIGGGGLNRVGTNTEYVIGGGLINVI